MRMEIGIDHLHFLFGKWRPPSTSFNFFISQMVMHFDQSWIVARAEGGFSYHVLKLLQTDAGCYGLHLNLLGYKFIFFLIGKGRNSDKPVLMYDEEICSHLSK